MFSTIRQFIQVEMQFLFWFLIICLQVNSKPRENKLFLIFGYNVNGKYCTRNLQKSQIKFRIQHGTMHFCHSHQTLPETKDILVHWGFSIEGCISYGSDNLSCRPSQKILWNDIKSIINWNMHHFTKEKLLFCSTNSSCWVFWQVKGTTHMIMVAYISIYMYNVFRI